MKTNTEAAAQSGTEGATNKNPDVREVTLAELLPFAFSEQDLG